jgi:hypothetical protein
MVKCDLLKSETNNRTLAMLSMTSYITLSTCVCLLIGILSFVFNGQILSVQASEVDSTYHANKDYTTFRFIQVQTNTSSSNITTFKPQHDLIVIKSPSSSYIDKSGIFHITGEVQNNFGFPVQSVQVTATLYGSQKNIVDRKSAYTYIDQLKSGGGRSGFSIIVPANVTKNSTGYSISVTSYTKSAAAPLSLKPALLNLNINNGTKDLNGNYHLLGNVTNKGNNTATHVRVSTVFLNGTNKIIDAQGGFTTPMNLQSGQTASFNFTVLSPNLNEIKTVAVNTQSQEYSMMVNNNNNNNNNNSTEGSTSGGLVVPLPPVAAVSSSSSSSPITNNSNNKKPSLLLEVEKNPIISGNKQTIRVKLSDSTSDQGISGAKVKGIITPVSGHPKKEFSGNTDKSGHISYSWIINKNSKPGSFNVKVHVSTTNVTGYNSTFKNTSFKLIDKGISQTNTGTATPVKHSDNGKKTTNTNSEQRGENKVDKSGRHYYDVHNCSNKKGSSGIGDLSECEAAQRETEKESED